jgi:hypothetical protein
LAIVTSFTLAPGIGTVRASDLQWSIEFSLTQRVPGLFVRVDLETGPFGQGEACYASEFVQATALGPQSQLGVTMMGFTKSPRADSRCDEAQFKPRYAFVRLFVAADPFAQTPVAGGDYSVFVTVTE